MSSKSRSTIKKLNRLLVGLDINCFWSNVHNRRFLEILPGNRQRSGGGTREDVDG